MEKQEQNYKEIEKQITEHLALIGIHDEDGNLLFEKDDTDGSYVHRMRPCKSKVDRSPEKEDLDDNRDVSFHYMPYDFNSVLEQNFFKAILATLNHSIADVKVLLFTGA